MEMVSGARSQVANWTASGGSQSAHWKELPWDGQARCKDDRFKELDRVKNCEEDAEFHTGPDG